MKNLIIEKPCNIHKKELRIGVSYKDWETGKKHNEYFNPKDINEIVLTRGNSSISTSIFKLNPNLIIHIFNNGNPTNVLLPINNLPKILKNESLFVKLSKYKRRKLAFVFCKSICSSRINIISRLNETRNNKLVNDKLNSMREIMSKLYSYKTINELMGYEGNIAKLFYSCMADFNSLWKVVRNTKSKDIVNVLMNFSHTILRNRINTRLIINGVNPYHSFLHGRENRNENYLTWDFSEFWIAYVDKLIFYALEKGIMKETDIDSDGRLKMYPKNKIINLIDKRITNEEIDKKIKEFLGYLNNKNRFSWKT